MEETVAIMHIHTMIVSQITPAVPSHDGRQGQRDMSHAILWLTRVLTAIEQAEVVRNERGCHEPSITATKPTMEKKR